MWLLIIDWLFSLSCLIISVTQSILLLDSFLNLSKSVLNNFSNSLHTARTSVTFLPVLNTLSKQAKYDARESIKLRDAIFLSCTFLSKSSCKLLIFSLIWFKSLSSLFIANRVDNALTSLTCNNFNSFSNCFSFSVSLICNWVICSVTSFTADSFVATFVFCISNAFEALSHAASAIFSASSETEATLDDICSFESWSGCTKASTSFVTAFILRLRSESPDEVLSISDKVFFSL